MIWQRLIGPAQSALRGLLNPSPSPSQQSISVGPLDLAELEDRILMSATPLMPDAMPDADQDAAIEIHDQQGDAAHVASPTVGDEPVDYTDPPLSDSDLIVDETDPDAEQIDHHELVFVDTSIDGYQALIDQIAASHDQSTDLQIIELDGSRDGIDQITQTLEQYDHVSAMHILSHGTDASVRLGNVWLDNDRLPAYAGDIALWRDSLTADADVLLYACNLASTADGHTLLESISVLTGADVAASTDITGHSSLGGDWDLEFSTGAIETAALLSHDSQTLWHNTLPTDYVFDGFESHTYAGNTGSVNWSGSWQEVGESDGANLGAVHIVHYDLDAVGSHCLEIDAVANRGLYREVDLSSASSAELHFDYQRHDSNGFVSSTLEVLVSDDGGSSWSTVYSIGQGIDVIPHSVTIDISAYLAADSQIQFLSTATGSGSIFIDHVEVSYEIAPVPPPNSAPILHSGGALSLTSILEDAVTTSGNTVAEILASAGDDRITDADIGALEGIAVVHVDDTHGTWQYDTLANGNWQAFGSVNDNSAVLLGTASKIRFVPTADYNGSAGQIEFRAWDRTAGIIGATGFDASSGGGELSLSSTTDTASIVVQAINDHPVLTLPADQSVSEDTSLAINGLTVSDVDADGLPLQVTLTVASGTLTLGDTTGLTFTTGTGAGDSSMTFSSSVADLNAALATLVYQGQFDFHGTDTLSVHVSDLGNTGAGGPLIDSGSLDIVVQAINDHPVLTLPADQSVSEDTSLAISGLTVSDVDADGLPLQVTLTVGDGTLTLGDTTGLTFTTGTGAGDSSMTFSGSVADLNAALATLVYQGQLDFHGTDTLSVHVSDLGNTGAGGPLIDSGSLDIVVQAINDHPVLTLPADQSVSEDTSLAISGLTVSDVDADGLPLQVTLTVGNGTLTLGDTTGLTFTTGTGAGDASMTFSGSVADLNAALATLVYQGQLDFHGTDTLSVHVSDLGNTGAGGPLIDSGSLDIVVQAINDHPVLTLPADQSVSEDTSLAISGLTVSDVDADGLPLQVTLTVGNGTLTLGDTTGLTFTTGTGAGDSSMTFSGSVADLNAALATLVYQGQLDFHGTDTLSVHVSDLGNTGAGGPLIDSGSLDIVVQAINDHPVLTLPADQSVSEDTSLAISGLTVSDVDADGLPLQVTLTVGDGTLTLGDTTGLTFTTGTGAGDSSMTFSGSVADLNAALATLVYQGQLDFHGTDTLSVHVSDLGNTGAGGPLIDSGSLDIVVQAINDHPVLTLPADQSVSEDTSLAISGLTVSDVDADGLPLQVTLTVGDGTLTLGDTTGLTFTTGTGAGDSSMTFSGSVADLNAALATLVYQGQLDFHGTDTLSVHVSDLGNTGAGGPLIDSGSLDIVVQAINDHPVLTLPADQSVSEDTSLAISGLTVSDVDADGLPLQVTLTVGDGTLTLGDTTGLTFTTGTGAGDSSMTFSGSVADLNAALATLVYQGQLDFHGTDTLSVHVSDLGNTGAGGPLIDSGSLDIVVQAINDHPVLTLPADQSVSEDTSLAISGLTVSDVDADGLPLQVTLTVGDGTLTLGDTTGLTFTTGTGAGDSSMTFSGSVADLNAALATLVYQGQLDFHGTDTLSVHVSDLGNTGAGGPLIDSGSLDIVVQAINDHPVLTLPADQSVSEDTSLAISGLTVSDVDADGLPLQVTLTVGDGTLTLGDTTGLTFTTGTGAGDSSMTFSGSVADLNAALATLVYQGQLDFHGTDTLSVHVSDLGNTGAGGPLIDSGSLDIVVQAINDHPVLTLPADQSVSEDTSLAISGLTVSDVDADGLPLQVTLTVGDGTLTLGDTSGLTFTTGTGAGDSSMTFSGSVADLNAALATLVYQGQLDFHGTDTLSVHVSDLGNTGAGGPLIDSGSLDIVVQAINDHPVLTLPADQSVSEDTSLAISGLTVSDVDADGLPLQVTLTVGDGTLTLGDTSGLTFTTGTGAGDSSMTFSGSVADLNAALATLVYQGQLDFHGTDTLSVHVSDLGNTGAGGPLIDSGSLDIVVQAINDHPVLTLPADQSVSEDTSLAISGLTVSDVDADGLPLQVTLTVGDGTLTLGDTSGLTFTTGTGAGDSSMTFSGSVADLNAALATLVYQGQLDFHGTDTLSVHVSDLGNTGAGGPLIDSGSLDIVVQAINDHPVLTLPADQSVSEDTSLAISGLTVSDVDADGLPLQVTLTVGDGTLTLGDTTGLTFTTGTGAGDASMTFSGSVADLNAALATLVYQGQLDFHGTDTLSVHVSDLGNTGAGGPLIDSGSLDIVVQAINDHPVLTLPADQSVSEDTSLAISGLTVSDVDADGLPLQVTLTVGDGTLTLGDTSGLTFTTGTGAGDSSMTFSGSVADLNAALATLVYQGQLDFHGTDTLSVHVSDLGNTGAGGPLIDSGSLDIVVQAINDHPVLTLPADQSVSEDTSLAISGLTVSDVDADGLPLQVTLTVGDGTLTLGDTSGLTFTTGTGAGDSSMTFSGSVADLNAALATLVYQGQLDFHGTDTLSVHVSDLGNTGAGGPLIDSGSLDIVVQAINDHPVLTLPADQSVSEDTSLAISGLTVVRRRCRRPAAAGHADRGQRHAHVGRHDRPHVHHRHRRRRFEHDFFRQRGRSQRRARHACVSGPARLPRYRYAQRPRQRSGQYRRRRAADRLRQSGHRGPGHQRSSRPDTAGRSERK